MRIIVCDDDSRCRQETKKQIDRWLLEQSVCAEIIQLDNGDELLELLKTQPADLLFLDIMMPLLSGMEIARIIKARGLAIKLVFLTSSPEFAVESYEVKASGYLLKPVSYEKISAVLSDLLMQPQQEEKQLLVKTGFGYCYLKFDEIECMEAQRKKVLFYLKDGSNQEVEGGFSYYEEKLTQECYFFKCHRSYLVNLNYVKNFSTSEAVTTSGVQCPIARGLGTIFKDTFFRVLFPDE